MRGDASLAARIALRPAGIAGFAVVVGGLLSIVATLLPWATVVARLSMLGADDDRVVANLAGIPTMMSGWAALVCGLAAVIIGAMVVLDRTVPWTRLALILATVGLVSAGVTGLVALPHLDRVAGDEAATLVATTEGLPMGVSLELTVASGLGPWLALVGAAAVLAGTAAIRDL